MSAQAKPAEQYAEMPQQHHAAELGMWAFLATELLLFGVLFTSYLIIRMQFPQVFAEANHHMDIVLGSVETVVLLTSSFTMAWAVRSIKLGLQAITTVLLTLTALLGLVFVSIHLVEYYKHYQHHLVPGISFQWEGENPDAAKLYFFLYYVTTGLHMAHVFLGACVLGGLAWLTAAGKNSKQYYAPVELSGLYWHFVDIVWIYLFPMYYLIDRTS